MIAICVFTWPQSRLCDLWKIASLSLSFHNDTEKVWLVWLVYKLFLPALDFYDIFFL